MRDRLTVVLAAVLVLAALLACKRTPELPVPAADNASTLASTRKGYIGVWEGSGVTLDIGVDGAIDYKRATGSKSSEISGTIARFSGDDVVVSVPYLGESTLQVSSPPKQVAAVWKVVVDGVELTRTKPPNGRAWATGSAIDDALRKVGVHPLVVICPAAADTAPEFDCDVTMMDRQKLVAHCRFVTDKVEWALTAPIDGGTPSGSVSFDSK